MISRPLDELGRRPGERLGPVVGGEDVGLVGQQHRVGPGAVDGGQVEGGVALGVAREDVGQARLGRAGRR